MSNLKKQLRENKREIRRLKTQIKRIEIENEYLETRIELEKYDKSLFDNHKKGGCLN